MCKRLWVCAMALAGTLLLFIPASANLILNGDFENGTTNWLIQNVDIFGGLAEGNPGRGFILNHYGGALDPTISQTVNGLTVGGAYRLSGDFRAYHLTSGPYIRAFSVAVDNVYLADFNQPLPLGAWGAFTYDFTATSTSHVIYLMGERYGSDYSTEVDNIQLNAVPEPSSLLALFSGIGALGGLLARRRR